MRSTFDSPAAAWCRYAGGANIGFDVNVRLSASANYAGEADPYRKPREDEADEA